MARRKLLLADDSITIQKVVNLTFADEGIEVISVGDGDSAMEKVTETAPDLVLADVNMPGLNGYQLCEQIKQAEKSRHTPVILLVGSFEPFDETEAKRVGADDFLTKPFQSIRQLVTKVNGLLESKNQNVETPISSFADTLDMENSEPVVSPESSELGDAGMDDEMIQTNRVSGFALDESHKYQTTDINEEDSAKTQPLSEQDLKDFNFSESPDADREMLNEKFVTDLEMENQNPSAVVAPRHIYGDDDLLEISFDEDENSEESREPETTEQTSSAADFDEAKTENEAVIGRIYPEEPEINTSAPETQTENEAAETPAPETPAVASNNSDVQLSSETIDLIVRKVVEKLSDKVIREVAWEVVPQREKLLEIIREIVEEKLRET